MKKLKNRNHKIIDMKQRETQPSAGWDVSQRGGWGVHVKTKIRQMLRTSHVNTACKFSVSRVPSRTVAHKRCSFMPLPFTNKWDVPSQLHLCIKRPGCMFALKRIHQRKDINKGRTHCVTSFELILTPMTTKDDKKCAGEPFERITAIFLFRDIGTGAHRNTARSW